MHGAEGAPGNVVLVVEDDVLTRWAIAEALRAAGLTALEAASANEARAVLNAGGAIDLIFTDIAMPPGDTGIVLGLWVKARFPTLPLMITSGDAAALAAAQAALPDAMAFVAKPYNHDALVADIVARLARRAAG
jgi:two-component system, response regulator PdtaR